MLKTAKIYSTAVGYDIIVWDENDWGEERIARYKNVSAATMRRFYRLSGGFMNVARQKPGRWSR